MNSTDTTMVAQASDIAQVLEIDIRGQICPSCLLIALKEVNQRQARLKSGEEVLHILTDNRQATNTIPESVGNMGYQTAIEKVGGYYCIEIRK